MKTKTSIVVGTTMAISALVICMSPLAESQGLGEYKAVVQLQSATPGNSQSGHINVSGAVRGGQFIGNGSGLSAVLWSNLTGVPAGFADGIDDLTLPYSRTQGSTGYLFTLINNGSGGGGRFETNSGLGVFGSTITGVGVAGQSSSSTGVSGFSVQGRGVNGFSQSDVGVWAETPGSNYAMVGYNTGNGGAIRGVSGSGIALRAEATSGVAVHSVSASGYAGIFESNASSGQAVAINSNGGAVGLQVIGNGPLAGDFLNSASGGGVRSTTSSGTALRGVAGTGIALQANSSSGFAALLDAAGSTATLQATNSGIGPSITASANTSGFANSLNNNGSGGTLQIISQSGDTVSIGTSAGRALFAQSQNQTAVWGANNSSNNFAVVGVNAGASGGVFGQASGFGRGVSGLSASGVGVWGESNGGNFGVVGNATTSGGGGVRGIAIGFHGVWGQSTNGRGVNGISTNDIGVWGETAGSNFAILANNTGTGGGIRANSQSGAGVSAVTNSGTAIVGVTSSGIAIDGSTSTGGVAGRIINNGSGDGFYGVTISGPTGVTGRSTTGQGVVGFSVGAGGLFVPGAGVSGYSVNGPAVAAIAGPGQLGIQCNGNITASNKLFVIDHPLNPENMYLRHYCSEGAEPLNVYSGNVVLGKDGSAWVQIPNYVESITKDFRYQLTCIGGFANVFIESEVANGKFKVGGGKPGLKVSWRVEGVRNDLYIQADGAPTEVPKKQEERGKYLHPELYGYGPERSLFKTVASTPK